VHNLAETKWGQPEERLVVQAVEVALGLGLVFGHNSDRTSVLLRLEFHSLNRKANHQLKYKPCTL
jgi:hypothetical protein